MEAEPSNKRPRRSRKKHADKFCIKGQMSGHCRTTSPLCKFDKTHIDNPGLYQQVEEDSLEQDLMDKLAFTDEANDAAEELLETDNTLEEKEMNLII
jgi:hypothetical protein